MVVVSTTDPAIYNHRFEGEPMNEAPTRKQIAEARKLAKANGVNKLLSIDVDPKTAKSNKAGKGFYTAIQYLAPASVSGTNMCASASAGCIAACLHTAGNPVYFANKQKARIARTRFYLEHREAYFIMLYAELAAFSAKCAKNDLQPAVRLNGTSDIVWERVAPWIFEMFPNVQFYDYSKHKKRMLRGWTLPANYHLTFSRSETNNDDCLEILADNPDATIAVVFSTKRKGDLPATWNGYTVGDADTDDLRFLDTQRIAGLRAKGEARRDDSGFVVMVA